jgi:hypothetical protein
VVSVFESLGTMEWMSLGQEEHRGSRKMEWEGEIRRGREQERPKPMGATRAALAVAGQEENA